MSGASHDMWLVLLTLLLLMTKVFAEGLSSVSLQLAA